MGRGGDPLARIQQLVPGRIAAEAQADGGARLTIVEAEGLQDMARAAGATGTGAAERECDIPAVRDEPRAIHAIPPNVEIAEIAVAGAAVDNPVRTKRPSGNRPQLQHMIEVARGAIAGDLRRCAEAYAKSRRERTGPEALLLPTTVDERR